MESGVYTEKRREYMRLWRLKNRKKINAQITSWKNNNPEKAKAINDRWRSKNFAARTIRSPKLPDGGTPMMTEERLQWFKTLVAVHEPELGELFQEIDRLRSVGSALTQPPRQSIASDEIPYRGPFVFSAFGSGAAPARHTLYRQTILNQAKTNDKLRAELKEGHEHYIEILAKYCAANERAEKAEAEAENEQHDRKVKQEALREAAELCDQVADDRDANDQTYGAAMECGARLRASADALDPQAGGAVPESGAPAKEM